VKKKLPWMVLAVVAVAALALWWFWPFGGNGAMRLSGAVEIQEVRLASKTGGRVQKIFVNEGDIVEFRYDRVTELLRLEVPEWEAQRDQWEAKLKAAKAEYDRVVAGPRDEEKQAAEAAAQAAEAKYELLKNGYRDEEKRQAEAEWKGAEAERKQTEEDFTRLAELYRMRAAARADFDAALSARDRVRNRAEAAKAKHDQMQRGFRSEEIAQAKAEAEKARWNAKELYNGSRLEDIRLAAARVDEAKAKLAEAQVYVNEATVIVPKELGTARIEVLAVRPGDVVAANQPLIRVLKIDDWWVKVFVPETKLGLIKVDMEVDVYTDTDSHAPFKGRIVQIANVAEFTPRNVQSLDERRHQVFAVKVQVLNAEGRFHAGMAAEVVVPAR
jgi:HlyD family secretion protein